MMKKGLTSILSKPRSINSNAVQTSDEQTKEEEERPIPLSDKFQYEKGCCALEYWEPIKLLGEGSISDIHLVRRRSKRIHVRYKKKRDIMKFAKDQATSNKSRQQQAQASGKEDDDNDTSISSNLFVLKSIMKDHINSDFALKEMRDEIVTMSQLHHINIVKLYEAYERRRHVYLVMDYCSGGDLTDRNFDETKCARVLQKILSAVNYMHTQKNIVHRDLKLENIMMDGHGEIKIIDFGLATKYLSDEYKTLLTDRVGTLYTMAPQVLQGVYTSQCDLWSIGVIAYMLLSQGINPFWGPPRTMPWPKRRKVMIDLIMRCQYKRMTGPSWKSISQDAKDFVVSLLQMDPNDRPTAQQALESEWIIRNNHSLLSSSSDNDERGLLPSKQEQMARQRLLHMKRVAIPILSNKLLPNNEQDIIMKLRNEFEKYDTDGNDHISLNDFRKVLERHLSTEDIVSIFGDDNDNTRNVDEQTTISATTNTLEYSDFVIKLLDHQSRTISEKVAIILDGLDQDQSRQVSKITMLSSLQDVLTDELLAQIGAQIEQDADGNVSTVTVLEQLGKLLAFRVRDSVRSISGGGGGDDDDDAEEEGEEALIDADSVVIPGGRQTEHAKYIYDKMTLRYVTYSH